MLTNKPKTRLLVDGGDPSETLRIKSLIGFVDGQTTNWTVRGSTARAVVRGCWYW
jgi:hypothetical protein